jgi:hypothetical protein
MIKIVLTLFIIIFTAAPVYSQSHFGICGGLPVFADEFHESGAEIVRSWIKWSDIEKQNDVYNWTEMDSIVKKANERNIEVLGYFIDMPVWARNMDNPKCKMTQKGCLLDICEPKDWNDFREFAQKVSERYDGKHGFGEMKYIAVFNEVQGFSLMDDTEYGPWLINGYQAIKQGNPDVQVLLGAVHSPLDFPAAADFIDVMLRDYNQYYDIFNFHIYQKKDGAVLTTINYIKERMETYNINKPMWITETATFISNVVCNKLEWYNGIAKGVIKRYAQALGNGVEKVFWYCFSALPTVEEDSTGVACGDPTNFLMGGLGWVYPKGQDLDIYDFHLRPAYDTFRLMTSKLAVFSSVEKITDTQYKFIVINKDVFVLWCDTGGCSIPNEIYGKVKVTDYSGNEDIKDASEIVLTESPVFIEDSESAFVEDKYGNWDCLDRFYLFQNYPNPFNPVTVINYYLNYSTQVTLKIYNLSGQVIETLVDGFQAAGEHEISWQPEGLSGGIYFCRLQAGDPLLISQSSSKGQVGQGFSDIKKMIFLK